MSQIENIAERRQQMLARVAELDLVAVEAAHASYMAAIDTPEEAEKGHTYQRMAYSLRQSLALHERLERSGERAARARRDDTRREEALYPLAAKVLDPEPRRHIPRDIPAARARADDLRNAIHRIIWSEGFERSEREGERDCEGDLVRWLERRLDEDRCEDYFIATPIDEQIAEICAEADLNPDNVARWRDLPDPDIDAILHYLNGGVGRAPRRGSG